MTDTSHTVTRLVPSVIGLTLPFSLTLLNVLRIHQENRKQKAMVKLPKKTKILKHQSVPAYISFMYGRIAFFCLLVFFSGDCPTFQSNMG